MPPTTSVKGNLYYRPQMIRLITKCVCVFMCLGVCLGVCLCVCVSDDVCVWIFLRASFFIFMCQYFFFGISV